MWKSENIKAVITGGTPQIQLLKAYIQEKNLNFIIARGKCVNRCRQDLASGELDVLLDEFAACGAAMVSWNGRQPSPPFLAADLDPETRTARVAFLMDLTREAEKGEASPFYSKIMGALSTQFFAARPDMDRIWFPFILQDTVGRGAARQAADQGMFIIRG
ncbi:MAG: hypothetical protein HUN04_18460 [Desulfobacter sp.]|nr:MAG: hypothetical protein HUN04_18460 [Desulfobacter sp.]